MKRLSQYKSAEKGVRDLVNESEKLRQEKDEMVEKYYNKLKEDEKQKTQIQDLIQQNLDKDLSIKSLNDEKKQLNDNLVRMKLEIGHKAQELQWKLQQIDDLKEEL